MLSKDDADDSASFSDLPGNSQRGTSRRHWALGAVVAVAAALVVTGAALLLDLRPASSARTATPNAAIGAAEAQGSSPTRAGSFIVIGDWGWDPSFHDNDLNRIECQTSIATALDLKMRELGDVRFIINVGDSFYPGGVSSKQDPQWDVKWRQIYSEKVRSVPWYSVYGNHDYWHDPCACSEDIEQCAQINGNMSDLSNFFMPNYTWFLEQPDLGLDIIALDLNRYTHGWNKQEPPAPYDCQWTPCESKCTKILNDRTDESFRRYHEWAANSSAPNLLVFSHYPTDYFWAAPEFLGALRDSSKHHIEYFGGHRHNVDQKSTTSIWPNNNWLVGGGGGYGCDGEEQGFLVGEVGSDFHITTYPVLVDYRLCCGVA